MPVVLDLAALTVVGINLPFALYGYLMFGSATSGKCCLYRLFIITSVSVFISDIFL